MKTFLVLGLCLLSTSSFAGSADCTNSRVISSGFDGSLTSEDCVLVVNIPIADMAYVRGLLPLPTDANTGDEFTIQNVSPYVTEYGSYVDPDTNETIDYSYNYTGGIELEALYPDESSSDGVVTFAPNYYIKATFDGAHWQFTGGSL